MGRKYQEPKAGEMVWPVMKGYRMACCDCGLVHEIDFTVMRVKRTLKTGEKVGVDAGGRFVVAIQVYRNNRATAAIRRAKERAKCK